MTHKMHHTSTNNPELFNVSQFPNHLLTKNEHSLKRHPVINNNIYRPCIIFNKLIFRNKSPRETNTTYVRYNVVIARKSKEINK